MFADGVNDRLEGRQPGTKPMQLSAFALMLEIVLKRLRSLLQLFRK